MKRTLLILLACSGAGLLLWTYRFTAECKPPAHADEIAEFPLVFDGLSFPATWETDHHQHIFKVTNCSDVIQDVALSPMDCCGQSTSVMPWKLRLVPGANAEVSITMDLRNQCNAAAGKADYDFQSKIRVESTSARESLTKLFAVSGRVNRAVMLAKRKIDLGRWVASKEVPARTLTLATIRNVQYLSVTDAGRFNCQLANPIEFGGDWVLTIKAKNPNHTIGISQLPILVQATLTDGSVAEPIAIDAMVEYISDVQPDRTVIILGPLQDGTHVEEIITFGSSTATTFDILEITSDGNAGIITQPSADRTANTVKIGFPVSTKNQQCLTVHYKIRDAMGQISQGAIPIRYYGVDNAPAKVGVR